MSDFRQMLAEIRRPRLLIRAARFGMTEYNRDRDLKRLLASDGPASPERAVPQLIAEEQKLEATRQAGEAGYSLTRHIEILVALLSELRLLPRSEQAARGWATSRDAESGC